MMTQARITNPTTPNKRSTMAKKSRKGSKKRRSNPSTPRRSSKTGKFLPKRASSKKSPARRKNPTGKKSSTHRSAARRKNPTKGRRRSNPTGMTRKQTTTLVKSSAISFGLAAAGYVAGANLQSKFLGAQLAKIGNDKVRAGANLAIAFALVLGADYYDKTGSSKIKFAPLAVGAAIPFAHQGVKGLLPQALPAMAGPRRVIRRRPGRARIPRGAVRGRGMGASIQTNRQAATLSRRVGASMGQGTITSDLGKGYTVITPIGRGHRRNVKVL